MYTVLLYLHSLLRWVILLLAVIAIYRSYTGMKGNKPFTPGEKRIGLFLLIAAHTTLLIGLVQWFTGPWGLKNIENIGFGAIMKDRTYRFFAIEHPFGMILAVILITIGRGVSRKNISDRSKFKKTFWYFLLALLIILISIPWPFRVGVARPWL